MDNQLSAKAVLIRTGAYGLAFNEEGKILLVRQKWGIHTGKYDLPGGGIEPKETVEEALHREFQEELAMDFISMKSVHNLTVITEALHDQHGPYLFHQIALIYRVDHLTPIEGAEAELESRWIDFNKIRDLPCAPLLQKWLETV